MSFDGGRGNLPPSYQKDKSEIWTEIRKLWKKVNDGAPGVDQDVEEIVWSWGGQVNPLVTENAASWPAPYDLSLGSLILTLGTASNVDLDVTLLVNGVGILTATMPAGSTYLATNIYNKVPFSTRVHVRLGPASSGTGKALGVILRYKKGF